MERAFVLEQLAERLQEQARVKNVSRLLVGAVVRTGARILLVRRSASDCFLPGYFEVPGGNLEKGEGILDGMERELREETGLQVKRVYAYLGFFDAMTPNGESVRQFNFLLQPKSGRIVLSHEHSRYVWWPVNNTNVPDSMRMSEVMKDIVSKAAGYEVREPQTAPPRISAPHENGLGRTPREHFG